MVGWHHRFNGHEFEQTLGDSEGQGSLACCSPWGRKPSDTTQQLNDMCQLVTDEENRNTMTGVEERRFTPDLGEKPPL